MKLQQMMMDGCIGWMTTTHRSRTNPTVASEASLPLPRWSPVSRSKDTADHRRQGMTDDDDECPICMMDYEVDDEQSVMPCKHRFHDKCLAGWLANSHLCPLCRHALPTEAHT